MPKFQPSFGYGKGVFAKKSSEICKFDLICGNLKTCTWLGSYTDHAKCENCESIEQAKTSQPIAWNSSTRSLYAIISVGQTNVKSRG